MPTRCQLRIRNTLQFCSSGTSKLSSDTVAVKTVWIYTEQRNKNDDELFMKAKDKKNIFAKEESTTCSDKLFIMSLQSTSPTHNIFLWWREWILKYIFAGPQTNPAETPGCSTHHDISTDGHRYSTVQYTVYLFGYSQYKWSWKRFLKQQ